MPNVLRHVQGAAQLPQHSLKVQITSLVQITRSPDHQLGNIYHQITNWENYHQITNWENYHQITDWENFNVFFYIRQDVAYFGVDMTKDPPEPKLTYYHCVEGECIKV